MQRTEYNSNQSQTATLEGVLAWGHFFLMILTTRVFCPPGTQYTRGGGDYLSWEYLSMGTEYPRKKCPGDKYS